MRDLGSAAASAASGGAGALAPPTLDEIRDFRRRLALDVAGGSGSREADAERIDRLRALEELRCATEAAQAETTADFTVSRRQAAADAGVRVERRDRGIGSQVGLARRESPHRGGQDVALAMTLRTELPHTRAAFRAGRIDRWRATLIARETACLSAEHRMAVDEQVCGDRDQVEGYSLGDLMGHLARLAAELDPASVAERRRRAEADRRTSLRPAADTMTWFGALLPVRDGVAVHATLEREARRLRAAGDPRTRGQLMADLLVAWITRRGLAADATGGPTHTDPNTPAPTPVVVNVVVPSSVLFGDADAGPGTPETGWVDDYGPVPGDLLREWIATNLESDAERDDVTVWLRRLYSEPGTGRLVGMDSRAELFTGRLAEFLRLRDARCRTQWCDAPIRHLDHVVPRADGGPTTAENGQGLCEHCNHAKQAEGWQSRPRPGPRHTVETTTPTGHRYTSVAPSRGP